MTNVRFELVDGGKTTRARAVVGKAANNGHFSVLLLSLDCLQSAEGFYLTIKI
jgi:hypothetical protein